MTVSESQKAAARKWDQANMTRLSCKVTKVMAEKFKAICQKEGTNTNAVLLEYVRRYIQIHEEAQE